MPQFEPTWFASQIFWLVVIFYVFYRLLKARVIPEMSGLLADRDAKIRGDLELAERRRAELEAMRTAYEVDLANARAEAQNELRAAQIRMAEKQTTALEVVGMELAGEGDRAEQRIAAEKAAALAELRTVAIEVAQAAASRLAAMPVDRGRIEAAVDASLEGR